MALGMQGQSEPAVLERIATDAPLPSTPRVLPYHLTLEGSVPLADGGNGLNTVALKLLALRLGAPQGEMYQPDAKGDVAPALCAQARGAATQVGIVTAGDPGSVGRELAAAGCPELVVVKVDPTS
jgi:hypothetical protein